MGSTRPQGCSLPARHLYCKISWVRRVSTSVADDDLRDRVAPDMYSDVTSSDENIDTVVDVAMSNFDAEYEALVAEYAVSV